MQGAASTLPALFLCLVASYAWLGIQHLYATETGTFVLSKKARKFHGRHSCTHVKGGAGADRSASPNDYIVPLSGAGRRITRPGPSLRAHGLSAPARRRQGQTGCRRQRNRLQSRVEMTQKEKVTGGC